MSEKKNILTCEVVDGVRIFTYDDGSQSFEPVDQTKSLRYNDTRSWWQKLKDWWNDTDGSAYIAVRDMSDPFDKRKTDPFDDGSGSKTAAEIGIQIKF